MAAEKSRSKEEEDRIWREIREKTEALAYGTVSITVHEGKIVQVETSTKTRYS